MSRQLLRRTLLWGAVLVSPFAQAIADVTTLRIEVDAGDWDRENSPIRLDAKDFPGLSAEVRFSLKHGSVGLKATGGVSQVQLDEVVGEAPANFLRLTFVLEGKLPAHTRRVITVDPTKVSSDAPAWSITESSQGALDLKNRDRSVFRYNAKPTSHPNYGPIQRRDAYIHPAFTPSGQLITGDYSTFHPHHRGFFLAYAHSQVGNLHPDFWNIHAGSGKVYCDGIDTPSAGPVVAKLGTRHRWEVKGGGVVLRERWDIAAYDIPGQPYWLFDVTSTQKAEAEPVEIQPYRYGGMAYRGADPFVKGGIDVMTSDGAGRIDRDQKPARWVDLTGPVADGSSEYGGAMIADHPGNANHPTVARIHPTILPFFSFVPGYKTAITITKDDPTVFRYRVLIHDGRPDRDRDERVWRDFATPPQAKLLP